MELSTELSTGPAKAAKVFEKLVFRFNRAELSLPECKGIIAEEMDRLQRANPAEELGSVIADIKDSYGPSELIHSVSFDTPLQSADGERLKVLESSLIEYSLVSPAPAAASQRLVPMSARLGHGVELLASAALGISFGLAAWSFFSKGDPAVGICLASGALIGVQNGLSSLMKCFRR